jgi:hypothetical protein
MPESTLLGRGLHKNKSINVEANLLDEWLSERRSLESRVRLRYTITFGIVLACAVLIPAGLSLVANASRTEKVSQERFDAMELQMKALDAKGKAAEPVLRYQDLAVTERRRDDLFLGHILLIFNAAPNKVVLSKLKADVVGGDETIVCSAESEDLASGNEFVNDASKGPNVEFAVLSSSHKSSTLAKEGIGFDFNKKVGVDK